MNEELICPVCLELFKDPILLPCSHNVCRECMWEWIKHGDGKGSLAGGDGAAATTVPGNTTVTCADQFVSAKRFPKKGKTPLSFTCPSCRVVHKLTKKGLDEFPVNRALRNIVESYEKEKANATKTQLESKDVHVHVAEASRRQMQSKDQQPSEFEGVTKDDILCHFCEGQPTKATKGCQQCQMFYCDACFVSAHPLKGPFALHIIKTSEELKNTRPQPVCEKHKKMLEIFCTQCIIPVCHLCALVGEHKGHDLGEIGMEFQKKKSSAQTYLTRLKERGQKIQEEKKILENGLKKTKENCSKLCEKVKRECAGIIQQVQEKEHEMISELKQDESVKLKKIEQEKLAYDSKAATADDLAEMTKKILEEEDPVYFLMEYESVSSSAQQELSAEVKSMNLFADEESSFRKDFVMEPEFVTMLQKQLKLSEDAQGIGTIEVRGFKESTHDEVIRRFFESRRRSGGGEIKSMEVNRKENKARITFEDAKVVSRIVQRGTLTLEDVPLKIWAMPFNLRHNDRPKFVWGLVRRDRETLDVVSEDRSRTASQPGRRAPPSFWD